jgi:hypothetical protein
VPGSRGLRAAGTLIVTAGLASAALAAAPAGAVASAAVTRAAATAAVTSAAVTRAAATAAAPAAATARSAAGTPARSRPLPPAPLSAQRPLAVPRAPQLPSTVHRICPVPSRVGQMECMSLVRTNTRHFRGVAANVTPAGYGPANLQSAYNLAAAAGSGGTGQTVAVVDAYDDPNAEADLGVYRSQYGLPACTTANGCFKKVNQSGVQGSYPPVDPTGSWEAEEAIDLEMVSAICPNCHILLVEANDNGLGNLGIADNRAVSSGAAFVSDSWNGVEFPSESYYDNSYFYHPGVAIAVAAGDGGYGTGWPSSSQYVTSVGGTSLNVASGTARGWTETGWPGTGSGCSAADPKPSWQTMDDSAPNGCLNRTANDVSAVADPATGVASYNTYGAGTGWSVVGGTSVATPIIASVYALAGTPAPGTYPASYLYQSGSAAGLNDVTSGSNGSCEPARQYLCTAGPGYDGPSGLGTPDGTAAFASSATGNIVTVTDPGVQDEEAGTPVFLAMQAIDSASGQTLTYSATGLPAGLTIDPGTGHITGTLTSATGTSTVTVTATDGTGAKGTVTFSIVAVSPLTTGYFAVAGPVQLDLPGMCMDDSGNRSRNGNPVQIYTCNGNSSQKWTYEPDGNPGGAGTLTINSKCLDIANRGTAPGSKAQLYTCDSGANQQWLIDGSSGELYNPVSGLCLTDTGGTTKGTQLTIQSCVGATDQAWILPASPVQSGVTGKCMNDPNSATANGSPIVIWNCKGYTSERWTLEPDGTLRFLGKCLDVLGRSKLDGAVLQLHTCNTNVLTNANEHWSIGSNGELFNVNSGRCLEDPGNNTKNGTQLVQGDCYGLPGEIWAVT